jgi:hypothetical protein
MNEPRARFFICGEVQMDQEELKAADDAFNSGYDDKPTETPAASIEAESNAEGTDAEAAAAAAAATPADDTAAKEEAPVVLKDVLARFDKFQQSHDKLAGNLGRMQQSYEQLQQQLATAQAATKTVDDAPGKAEMQRAAEDPVKWAALKKEFPDWAEATEELLNSRAPAPTFDAAAFKAELATEMAGQTRAMQDRIIDASLNAVLPGWKAEVTTPEFNSWMESQPDPIKALRASNDVGDAARMLKLYDAFKSKPAPVTVPDAKKPEPSAREKRLAAAVAPKGTGGHAAGRSDVDEFESGYAS